MENHPYNTQLKFFGYLIHRFGPEKTLYNTMECLSLKKGAVYKRMNGETSLSATELISLAIFFSVSLDTVFSQNRYITFEHPFSKQPSVNTFFELFTFFLKPLKTQSNSTMVYLANELPVFYYFSFPNLFNFIISTWSHLHWSDSRLEIKQNEGLDQHIQLIRKEISTYYDTYRVTEIWNNNMFSNLYQQINFAVTIKAFDHKSTIESILQDIRSLIEHLYLLTAEGKAEGKTERRIYLNDFGNYLNIVLYESEKINTTFVGYDIPQFLVSYDKPFFEFSKEWIKKIRRRSSLISGEGYQTRELFFQKIENEFTQFENKVSKLIEVYYG